MGPEAPPEGAGSRCGAMPGRVFGKVDVRAAAALFETTDELGSLGEEGGTGMSGHSMAVEEVVA